MQPTYNDFQQTISADNSDIFWLVFADYCDENEITHDIREQVNAPKLDSWSYEYTYVGVGCMGIGGVGVVGSVSSVGVHVWAAGVAGLNWYGVGAPNYCEGVGGN